MNLEAVIEGASPLATEQLIEEWNAHGSATAILADITDAQAATRLAGWPYSIAEVVAHMQYWQEATQYVIETGQRPAWLSEDQDWPVVPVEDWPAVREQFLNGLEKSRSISRCPDLLNRPYDQADQDYALKVGDEMVPLSVGVKLLISTTHHSYHLGQIVLMRRLMGAWSPPRRHR